MNVRHQQGQHNHQEDDFGAKQEAIEQVDQRGANAHHRPAEQGEDQYACGRRRCQSSHWLRLEASNSPAPLM